MTLWSATRARRVLGALALCFSNAVAHAQSRPAAAKPDIVAFDRYVAQGVRDWRAPGLAIAVVHGDSVVLAKGYGVLDIAKPDRVSEHTRFAIGSTTKAMTSVALGMLVDEGKLRFDDRDAPNVAVPHAEIRDTVRQVPIRTTDPVASAGSVWSSVSDMAKWMRFVLDSGRVGTKRLLTPTIFSEIVSPQIRVPQGLYPALRLARPHGFSYALGWFVQDYQGEVVWMHTGSINGMSAIIGLLPDRRVGVFVLANLDHAELRHALMYKIFDLYAGNTARDCSAELRALFTRGASAASNSPPPAPDARLSLPMERYAGTYVDSTYGEVVVTHANGTLRARFGKQDLGALEPWGYESFRSHGPPPQEQRTVLTFTRDAAGNAASVRVFGLPFARAAR